MDLNVTVVLSLILIWQNLIHNLSANSDFLYLLDKEVSNIGAITELTIIKMEIKEPSAAHGSVCDCWKAELAPALLSC